MARPSPSTMYTLRGRKHSTASVGKPVWRAPAPASDTGPACSTATSFCLPHATQHSPVLLVIHQLADGLPESRLRAAGHQRDAGQRLAPPPLLHGQDTTGRSGWPVARLAQPGVRVCVHKVAERTRDGQQQSWLAGWLAASTSRAATHPDRLGQLVGEAVFPPQAAPLLQQEEGTHRKCQCAKPAVGRRASYGSTLLELWSGLGSSGRRGRGGGQQQTCLV